MQHHISEDDLQLLQKWFNSIVADSREGKTMTTATDTTQHTPGPLGIFRVDDQTGLRKQRTQVEPGETYQCGRKIPRFILGAPDDLVLCKRCAQVSGYDW